MYLCVPMSGLCVSLFLCLLQTLLITPDVLFARNVSLMFAQSTPYAKYQIRKIPGTNACPPERDYKNKGNLKVLVCIFSDLDVISPE